MGDNICNYFAPEDILSYCWIWTRSVEQRFSVLKTERGVERRKKEKTKRGGERIRKLKLRKLKYMLKSRLFDTCVSSHVQSSVQ